MKVKKTGNLLMKKYIAWILVLAMILPILPMIPAKAVDAETLNPELEEISFCNFVDASGVALADGTHSLDKDDWVFQGYYSSNGAKESALENKVINMDITFKTEGNESIYFGGPGIWEGLFLKHNANTDYLVFGGTTNQFDPIEILPGFLTSGKTLAGRQFNFKLSFEIEENETDGTKLKLGVWIDDELYKNQYIDVSEYSTYTYGYIHAYLSSGGAVDIQSYRKQWNWNSPLEQITANDFLLYQGNGAVVEDGTYENKDADNGAYLLYSSYGAGFSGKVFNVDIKFSDENIMFKVGGNMWNKDMSLYRASGAPENGLYLQYGGVTYTLTQAGAGGVDLTENEFNLKLSFEEEDSDGDLTNDRLKLGVWIDNQLYANTYFYATDYSNYIVGDMGVCAQKVVGGYVKLSSCPPTLNPTLEQFTFSDFYSDISGTYNMSGSGWLLIKEYFSNGTTTGAFAGKVLSGHVTFGSGPFNFRLGSGAKSQWSNTFFAFWRDAETPDDAVYFGFNGVRYTLTSDIAQTDLLDKKFNLKISFEEVDTNADGQNDRLRLGLWFNDVLYNDEYFTVDGGYSDFVSGCVFIQGLGEGNGYVKLASYNEKEKEGTYITETNTGDMNRIPYNNDETTADLGLGAASYMVVVDRNNDGYMDLMVGSNCVPFGGTYIFYGGAGSQNVKSKDYLLMEKARKISDLGNTYSATYLYDANGDWEKTLLHGPMVIENDKATPSWAISDAAEYPTVTALGWRQGVSWPSEIDGDSSSGYNPIRQNLVDFDGDGYLDYITGWGCWDEYSEEEDITGANVSGDKFDSNGVWGDDNGDRIGDDDGDGDDDPLHAWIVWNKNTGESSELLSAKYETESQLLYVYDYEVDGQGNKIPIESSKHPLDVYGGGYPQFSDFDHDGDLDIVCCSFIGELIYFENIGTRTAPVYAEGRSIVLEDGTDIMLESPMPTLTIFDWNNDGYMDLICGGEDGRVCLVEHTGTFDANGTPIMKDSQFFQTPADSLKQGVLNTPYSVDWDGDGDEDIISGDSSGYIAFIKNLSIEKNHSLADPVWDNPVRLKTPDGEVYRFKAGYNGSIQGPAEAEWGYTQVSVADWDGDGVLDIMSSNISGRVFWHRGIAGNPYVVEDARAVEVEWENGNKYPTWNWWKPNGNELVTQWRVTPYMIDLPLDEDGDGVAKGDGLVDLVIMDHEGYLTFFQRYKDKDGNLKLKEGQRIFKLSDGTTSLRFSSNAEGKSGKVAYALVDYDQDGDIDILRSSDVNIGFYENISFKAGEYKFAAIPVHVHDRMLADHTPAPAICDWNQDNVPDLLVGTMDGHLYYMVNNIAEDPYVEPENPEVLDSTLKQITFDDFGIPNGKYDHVPGKDFVIVGDYNSAAAGSLTNKVISGNITFSDSAWLYVGGDIGYWYGFSLRGAGSNLVLSFGGEEHTIKSNIAKVQLVGAEFNLKLSLQEEGGKIKLGVWINDKLYKNQYFEADAESYARYLYGRMGIYPPWGGTYIEVESVEEPYIEPENPEVLDSTLQQITFDDFNIANGRYDHVPGKDFVAVGDYNGAKAGSLTNKVINGNITFSEHAWLYVGGDIGYWYGFSLRGSGGNLILTYGGQEYAIKSEIAKTQLVGKEFNLKLSLQEEGDKIKLGVWINDKLYKNQYFEADAEKYAAYLYGRLGIYPPWEGTYIEIESVTEAFVGHKEVLNPKLKQITFLDFGIKDGTYYHSGDFTAWGEYNSGKAGSLANTVVCGDVTFSKSASWLYIGGDDGLWSGLSLRSSGDNLILSFGGKEYPIKSGVAGLKLVENKFNLKMSYEVEDGQLKLGVWINDKLYEDTYFYLKEYKWGEGTKTYENYLYGRLGIFPHWSKEEGNSWMTIASWEKPEKIRGSVQSGPFVGDKQNSLLYIGMALTALVVGGVVTIKMTDKKRR